MVSSQNHRFSFLLIQTGVYGTREACQITTAATGEFSWLKICGPQRIVNQGGRARAWEMFEVVDVGKGYVAFYNHQHRRFMRFMHFGVDGDAGAYVVPPQSLKLACCRAVMVGARHTTTSSSTLSI